MQPVFCYHGYKVIWHSCAVCASSTNQLWVQLVEQVENNCPIVGPVVCGLFGVHTIKSKWRQRNGTVQQTTQKGKAPQTLSEITFLWYWHYVNLRVPNDVQRKIQVKLKQPNSAVMSFHSITAKHHKWLIMGTKAAQTDYVHTRHQGDLYEDTKGSLRGGFSDTKSIPSFTYSTLCLTPPQCLDDKWVRLCASFHLIPSFLVESCEWII